MLTRPLIRPLLEKMSDTELAALNAKQNRCRGVCRQMLTFADFELTTERGRKVHRTQCRVCMKAYYAAAHNPKAARTRIADVLIVSGPKSVYGLAVIVGLSSGVVRKLLDFRWFERDGVLWSVTNAARAEVMEKDGD